MWVDIDDLRADLERLYRKDEEELRGEEDMNYRRMLYGILAGYRKVEMMLDEQEEAYCKKACEGILQRASKSGKTLPKILEEALTYQANIE